MVSKNRACSPLKWAVRAALQSQSPIRLIEPGLLGHKLAKEPPLRGPATHGLYELAICSAGKMMLVGMTRMFVLKAGDIVVIAPGAWHYETCCKAGQPYQACWVVPFGGHALCNFSLYRRGKFEAYWLRGVASGGDHGSFFRDLIGRIQARGPHWKMKTRGLVIELLKDVQRSTRSVTQPPLRIEFEPLDKLLKIMETRFGEPLEIRLLARTVGLSPNYLSHLFKKSFHTTFTNYVNLLRVWHAQLLLEYGLTPKEAAVESGFKNVHYFTTVFTQKCEISPGRYRRTCLSRPPLPSLPRVALTPLSATEVP
ncbi:MAG: helix-turn-helix transcriptional regulator [Verrucomicrobia bacterium]|nr:helix-turn-helix transcriptional regulator [Verrucomicrobiota bacterium]